MAAQLAGPRLRRCRAHASAPIRSSSGGTTSVTATQRSTAASRALRCRHRRLEVAATGARGSPSPRPDLRVRGDGPDSSCRDLPRGTPRQGGAKILDDSKREPPQGLAWSLGRHHGPHHRAARCCFAPTSSMTLESSGRGGCGRARSWAPGSRCAPTSSPPVHAQVTQPCRLVSARMCALGRPTDMHR